MTEIEIYHEFQNYININYPEAIIWKAPVWQKQRWDIFGVFDAIVLSPNGDVRFIQYTTLSNISYRRKKIKDFLAHHNFKIKPIAFLFGWNDNKKEFKIEEIKNDV